MTLTVIPIREKNLTTLYFKLAILKLTFLMEDFQGTTGTANSYCLKILLGTLLSMSFLSSKYSVNVLDRQL